VKPKDINMSASTGTPPQPTIKPQTADVPAQIFDTFIKALVAAKVSTEVTDRLRQTLLVDNDFNEPALRNAIFGEDGNP
jgi:hypothetical protein